MFLSAKKSVAHFHCAHSIVLLLIIGLVLWPGKTLSTDVNSVLFVSVSRLMCASVCVCVWCSDNAFCSLIAIVLSYRARSGDLFEHILSFFLSFISMTAYSQSMRYNYDDNHMYVKCLSA